MQNPLRKLFFLLMLGIVSMTAYAVVVRGTVLDSEGLPVESASVRLLKAKDSAFVAGTTTNAKGLFRLRDVAAGNYVIETKFIGYDTQYMPVRVQSSNVTTDTIRLGENSIMLKEVSVVGVKTPIKVMEDTIEYNADTYKTQPNAVVEDLLKRLPGVEVDSDGKITANGKEVKKILIDGKEFFSDDPKVASKNLPVNMVEKLQVVDRKSDLARLTGVDDGEDETVINLTVKPGMKNGYFGTIEGGYGTDSRYMGSFNVNRFWNDNQVTLLGNFNNINELGFTDSNGNRFRRFGGTNGINTSQALGLNFNVGKGEIFRVGGDVMYSHTDRKSTQTANRQYYTQVADSMSYSDMWSNKRDRGHNVRGDFRIEWKPDSFNTFDFRPSFSYNKNDSWSIDSTLNRAGDPAMSRVSNTYNSQDSKGNSFEFGASLIYNHNFRNKPGRSFSIHGRYNHSNVREYSNAFSRSMFYLMNDSIDIYDQYEDDHTWSDMAMARLSWTEPLGDPKKGNYLTFAYRLQYRWNNTDKIVYDHPVIYPDDPSMFPWIDYSQEILNDSLSNRFRNDYFNQDIRMGYKHVSSTHNLDVGISAVPQMSKSENLITDAKSIPTRWVWNFAPYLRYRYKMGKSKSLQLNYMGRSSQPSMTQLQPVADMSDPMNIVVGNPSLDPSFSHNIRLRYQGFSMASQRSLMVMGDFSVVQNSIISKTTTDPLTNARLTTYENVNGVWNGRLMAMMSQPLRNKAWQLSAHVFTNFNQQIGYTNGLRNRSFSFGVNVMPAIAFRPDNLELELRPRYSLQTISTTIKTNRNDNSPTVHTYGGMFNAYYYTPIGIILNTDLNYTATKGYAAGYNKNEWMWNASISYQLLRDKSLTLSVKAYDLLQQKSNISRTINSQYISDVAYNDLTRYFMFTVSYKFNTFGKGKEPSGRDTFDGPGGPGRRGPGGPPPGGGHRPPMH